MADLVVDVAFCFSLLGCGEWLLLACSTAALVATFLTTWYLGATRRWTAAK